MSAWSPGNSVVPSPAVQGAESLEPSPMSGTQIPLPLTVSDGSPREPKRLVTTGSPERTSSSFQPDSGEPSTPSPRSFAGHINLNREDDGFATPGMWSTMATPGTEDVYQANDAMGGISESPSARAAARRKSVVAEGADEVSGVELGPDAQDDTWSTAGNESMSRQNSWNVTETEVTPLVSEGVHPPPPPLSGIGLGLQPNEMQSVVPVKKVHFSPSVVGGLSSTSSSIAGSSPPGSPGGYVPSLSTVPETTHSSDSERDSLRPSMERYDSSLHPIPMSVSSASEVEAEGSPHSAPPVIHKVTSPVGPLSPNGLSSPRIMPQVPSIPPTLVASAHLHIGGPPLPQFPVVPSLQTGVGPQTLAQPTMRPTPRPAPAPPVPPYGTNHVPPRSPSPPPELTSTQIARIQKHCRFAISALDYEDAETARKELRSALAMLGS
jgi:vacuolar protein sorting-associated protein VTA1